jgi:hypothetical protein
MSLLLTLDAPLALTTTMWIWVYSNQSASAWLRQERGDARIEQLLWMKGAAFDLPKGPQHRVARAPATSTTVKSRSADLLRREEADGTACGIRWRGRGVSICSLGDLGGQGRQAAAG